MIVAIATITRMCMVLAIVTTATTKRIDVII